MRGAYLYIRIRVGEPDCSNIPDQGYDWMYRIYGSVKEMVRKHTPKPVCRPVLLVHYVNATLFHDAITDRIVTGMLDAHSYG